MNLWKESFPMRLEQSIQQFRVGLVSRRGSVGAQDESVSQELERYS